MNKYLISLEKDTLRRELFFSQPDTQDFEYFTAINTMNKSLEELSNYFNINKFSLHYSRAATNGEIGCTLSHLAIYQKIIENNEIEENQYSLICEDDALFSREFQKHLNKLINQSIHSDIILLGQSKVDNFNHFELELSFPTTLNILNKHNFSQEFRLCYPYKNYFAGTVCYLIKKSAARTLLQQSKMQENPYWLADDFILFGKKFNLDIQIIRPLMAIENPQLDSNLQSTRGATPNNLLKKIAKYPLKKFLAIMRNLGNQ